MAWAQYRQSMLTSFDDYPIHPGSVPIALTGTSDANHYDRYFFNGYRRDASLYFGVALGLYPNRHVVDASFSVVLEGREQISLHASGRAPSDRRDANRVGPIDVQIIEPMRRHRIVVDSPDHGIRAELVFVARSSPVQEPHFSMRAGQRVVFDYTRLTQFGHWEGWIEIEGTRHDIGIDTSWGSRDRSWGVRPIGPPADSGAPTGSRQFFWLWAPVNFDRYAVHFDVNEYADGRRWHETGFFLPDGFEEVDEAQNVDYSITWRSGTRWARTFDMSLESVDGTRRNVSFEPLYDFQMLGIGYGHPEWAHGSWKGELAVGAERWSLPVADPCAPHHLHVQTVCRVRHGDDVGLGILEQMIIGEHHPTGLTGVIDPAP